MRETPSAPLVLSLRFALPKTPFGKERPPDLFLFPLGFQQSETEVVDGMERTGWDGNPAGTEINPSDPVGNPKFCGQLLESCDRKDELPVPKYRGLVDDSLPGSLDHPGKRRHRSFSKKYNRGEEPSRWLSCHLEKCFSQYVHFFFVLLWKPKHKPCFRHIHTIPQKSWFGEGFWLSALYTTSVICYGSISYESPVASCSMYKATADGASWMKTFWIRWK